MHSTPESKQILQDLFRVSGCRCDRSTEDRNAEETAEGFSMNEFVRAHGAIPGVLQAGGIHRQVPHVQTKNAAGGLVSAAIWETKTQPSLKIAHACPMQSCASLKPVGNL